jgi:hypothetical protein
MTVMVVVILVMIIIMTGRDDLLDRLCGLMVRVSGHRSRGSGFDSWRFQIF